MPGTDPGSMVSETNLAAEMGLSRTPVREALLELAKCRIVEVYPQKGSVISRIDYSMVEEARFMRSVLECAVVELACEMASEEDVLKLEENVKLQEFYLQTSDVSRIMELDNGFHKILFDITQKSQIYVLLQNISIHFDRVREMALTAVKDIKIVQDHRNIAEAIKVRDAGKAREIMEEHLNRCKIDEEAIREKYGADYFK